jgi:glutamate-ammonia-ligase adenylyltransferase
VRVQVTSMRARWRSERDRSTAALLDLKQGAGALLDIEFILQTLVLLQARTHPQLLADGNSTALIAAAERSAVLSSVQARALEQAHAVLLQGALTCTLDARSRLVPRNAELAAHSADVLRVARALGLDFEAVTRTA